MKYLYQFGMITLMTIGLFACGGSSGGSGGGSANNAVSLSTSNVESYSKAVIEAVNSVSNAGSGLPTTKRGAAFAKSMQKKAAILNTDKALIIDNEPCDVSGTYSLDLTDNVSTFILNNCNDGDGVTENGSFTFSGSTDGLTTTYTYNITYNYTNGDVEITEGSWIFTTSSDGLTTTSAYDYSVTFNGETESYATTQVCVNNSGTITCTFESDDYEIDGQTFSYVQTGPATGDGSTGYSCPLDVESDEGSVSIVANDIITCDNGYIQSGSIDIVDESEVIVATINFIDCTQFSITFNGSTTVYTYASFF